VDLSRRLRVDGRRGGDQADGERHHECSKAPDHHAATGAAVICFPIAEQ
jgi:hypothetical protein